MALTMKALQEQIDKLKEEIETLKANGGTHVKIRKDLKIGDTFELCGLHWTILDIHDGQYDCLADRLDDDMQLDSDSNDWRKSELREYLNGKFLKKICGEIGEENIIANVRDLTSLDGQTEYGTCEDKVSLLTVDEYRKYRALIPNADYWQWLITPWSTPCNDIKISQAVVSPVGSIYGDDCLFRLFVRPFVSFKSAIFESED